MWQPMLPTTLLKVADPAKHAKPAPRLGKTPLDGRRMTSGRRERTYLLVLWTARCTVVRGISKALATTQYEIPHIPQNRKTRASMMGPQPWSHIVLRTAIRALKDTLERWKSTLRSL